MASFILPIITGLAGLFGGKKQTPEQTNQSTSQSFGNFNSGTTPVLNSNQNDLMNYFTNDAINRYNKGKGGFDLKGYEAGGLENINRTADLKKKIMDNNLASRGLSFSPAAAFAGAPGESDRLNQSVQFENTLPQVQRQFQNEDFMNLLSAFGAIPTATQTNGASSNTGTTDQHGTQLIPGNPLAGALSGFGAGLATPSGGYDAKGQPVGGSNLAAILKALGLG